MSNRSLPSLVRRESSDEVHEWAEEYRDSQAARLEWVIDKACKHHSGGEVVELGSHPHALALDLDDELPADVIGVDLEPSRASRDVREQLDLRQCDLDSDRVPVGDSQAGLVVCSEVLEHLARPERAIAEMQRVLMPDGTGIITTPNFARLETRLNAVRGVPPQGLDDEITLAETVGHEGHRQLLSQDELHGLCSQLGLRVVDAGTVKFWPARSRLLDVAYRVMPSLKPYQYAVVQPAEGHA